MPRLLSIVESRLGALGLLAPRDTFQAVESINAFDLADATGRIAASERRLYRNGSALLLTQRGCTYKFRVLSGQDLLSEG